MRELDHNKWTDAERTEFSLKGWRSRRPGEWPPVCSVVRPAAYAHDLRRGVIEYDPAWRNYSNHTVRIPPGTIVRGCNFTQNQPDTDAIIITGPPDSVTFIDCNLCNVRLRPGLIAQGCNTAQAWLVTTKDAEGKDVEDRQWVARHSDDLTPAMKVAPVNAVLDRSF